MLQGCWMEMVVNTSYIISRWRISTYVNELFKAGFAVERIVEETSESVKNKNTDFKWSYYGDFKAKHFPLSVIFKAVKL